MVYPCLSLLRTTSLSPCTSCIYSTTHVDSQETAWDVFSDSQLGSELCLALSYDSTQGWQLFNWPQKKSNNKNGHNKTLQLDQHQIDQGSVASMSVTSVHSPDSHEHSHSSSTTDLDNLQLDADKLDDFSLVELEEVSESLEQECLALEAQGLNLNAESLFAEDRKPAACPEPGEITSDTKQEANDAANQTDNVSTPKSN